MHGPPHKDEGNKMALVSIVVPCHNEQESLPLFGAELAAVAWGMMADDPHLSFELVLVDDGSTDDTMGAMRRLRDVLDGTICVRWASFSRNFGKEAAMYCGLSMAKGDYVTTMDADLQDPPSLLAQMYALLMDDPSCDCVATRRVSREGEPAVRSLFARAFYRIANAISDTEFVDGARDFRLMRRRMVDAVLSLREYNRFSKGIFSWVGFSTRWLEYRNTERVAGTTSWSFWSLLGYSIDGIVGFSTVPLAFASIAGALCSVVALAFLVFVIVRALCFGDPVAGWPSLMSVILLLGGAILMVLGIMGQYLAKAYLETKARPLYILRETSDEEEPNA